MQWLARSLRVNLVEALRDSEAKRLYNDTWLLEVFSRSHAA